VEKNTIISQPVSDLAQLMYQDLSLC